MFLYSAVSSPLDPLKALYTSLPGRLHTCQSLRVGRSHYAFLDKLTTTGVVGKDYGFMLVWRCNFVGNHLITFGLFLDEVMGLSQYC